MARRYVHVVYTDGSVDDVQLRPVHICLAEEKFGELAKHAYQATMYAAYKATGSAMPWKGWLESVESADERTEDDEVPSTETGSEPS